MQLLLLLILNLLLLLLWLRIRFELLQVLHQVPEVLSEVLQQVVLHRLVCLELVQQAGGPGVVVPVLLVDHHVTRGVQGLLHLGHSALDLNKKNKCSLVCFKEEYNVNVRYVIENKARCKTHSRIIRKPAVISKTNVSIYQFISISVSESVEVQIRWDGLNID